MALQSNDTRFQPDDAIMMANTVFIVDDHAIMRRMLTQLAEDTYKVIGEAASAEQALESQAFYEADLLFIDYSLPGMSGIELIKQLHEKRQDCRCLMISAHTEDYIVNSALRAGAKGYVSKGHPDRLLEAAERVLAGEAPVLEIDN